MTITATLRSIYGSMQKTDDWDRKNVRNIERESATKVSLREFDLPSLVETSSESELEDESTDE